MRAAPGGGVGFSPDDIDREAGALHVVRQVRLVDSRLVFSPPKRNKTREVPMPRSILRLVDEHAEQFPPVPVTLPWRTPAGEPATARLLLTDERGRALRRNHFSESVWAPARKAAGCVENRPGRTARTRCATTTRRSCSMRGRASGRSRSTWATTIRASRSGHPPHAVQRGPHPARHRRRVREPRQGCRRFGDGLWGIRNSIGVA